MDFIKDEISNIIAAAGSETLFPQNPYGRVEYYKMRNDGQIQEYFFRVNPDKELNLSLQLLINGDPIKTLKIDNERVPLFRTVKKDDVISFRLFNQGSAEGEIEVFYCLIQEF